MVETSAKVADFELVVLNAFIYFFVLFFVCTIDNCPMLEPEEMLVEVMVPRVLWRLYNR